MGPWLVEVGARTWLVPQALHLDRPMLQHTLGVQELLQESGCAIVVVEPLQLAIEAEEVDDLDGETWRRQVARDLAKLMEEGLAKHVRTYHWASDLADQFAKSLREEVAKRHYGGGVRPFIPRYVAQGRALDADDPEGIVAMRRGEFCERLGQPRWGSWRRAKPQRKA